MYRPGGFPEYSPKDQKIFDQIQHIIRDVFTQRNFQHIWTPAVERNDILLKGGDTVANEIFGLVWLKDYNKYHNYLKEEATNKEKMNRVRILAIENGTAKDVINSNLPSNTWSKDYSLHFDLTVPFARYTLDHLSELVFPFKRYQMQPVWRGERQQRWRFKEFWQCDVDSIWKSGSNVWYWYAVETISTLQSAIQSVFTTFQIQKSFVTHISHIWLTKSYLNTLLQDETKVQSVVELLDKFYKKEYSIFVGELVAVVGQDYADTICHLIETKDYSLLENYDPSAFEMLDKSIKWLQKLGCNVVYDLTIVRGLWYYTDIVFETFIDNEINLWSICSGGWYEDFTKFIDPKNIYSGIGGSIGLSRMMELILEQKSEITDTESYMFLNFEDTWDHIIQLYQQFLSEGKICELYPTEAKFAKQLEFSDKKWCRYVVILGSTELAKWEYQIKDLKSWENIIKKL